MTEITGALQWQYPQHSVRISAPAPHRQLRLRDHCCGSIAMCIFARPFSPSSGARRAIFLPGLIEPVSRATAALRPEPTGPCPTGPAPTVPASSEAKESEHQPPRPTPRKRLRWRLGRGLTRLSASSAARSTGWPAATATAPLSPRAGLFAAPRRALASRCRHAAVTVRLAKSSPRASQRNWARDTWPRYPPAGLSLSPHFGTAA